MLFWNYKGMGKSDALIYLKKLVGCHKLDCLFLIETKFDTRKMENICTILKFSNYHILEAKGMGGGIALTWTEDLELHCMHITYRILICDMKERVEGCKWNIVVCYGTPYRKEKQNFWENLGRLLWIVTVIYCLLGI